MKKRILSAIAAAIASLLLIPSLLTASGCSEYSMEPKDMEPDKLPSAMTDFVFRFTDWFQGMNYDSDAPEGCVLLNSLLGCSELIDWSRYPDAQPVEHWYDGTFDPRRWCDINQTGYIEFDAATVDSICKKVFNLSDEQLAEQVKLGEQNEYFYLEDGKYYSMAGGVGDPPTRYEVTAAQFDGIKYYVDYNCYFDAGDAEDVELMGSYRAVVQLRRGSDGEYWSLYSVRRTDTQEY